MRRLSRAVLVGVSVLLVVTLDPGAPAVEAHGNHIHYASCGLYNRNNQWYGNNVRNYRFAGTLEVCYFDNAARIVKFWLGIREVNDGWPDQNVWSWDSIGVWEHGNVVAISRCKYDDGHDGYMYDDLYLGCWYHRW